MLKSINDVVAPATGCSIACCNVVTVTAIPALGVRVRTRSAPENVAPTVPKPVLPLKTVGSCATND